MRVVIDTNVLISGIFWSGPPNQVLECWAADVFSVYASAAMMEEYFEVIDRLAVRCGREDVARRWKTYLFEHCELVEPTCRDEACRDPDDAKFIECAVSVEADCLVSGDDDLLSMHRVGKLMIVKPAKFLEMLER